MTKPEPTTYAPGPGTAIVGPGAMLLIGATTGDPSFDAILDPVLEGASLSIMVSRLSSAGLDGLPNLALVAFEPSGPRVLLRGEIEVVVELETGSSEVHDGLDVSTWRELRFEKALTVELRMQGVAEKPSFSIIGGTAPAGVLRRRTAGVAMSATQPPSPPATATATPDLTAAPSEREPEPVLPRQVTPTPPPISDVPATAGPTAAASSTGVDDDFDFGHLLGETRHRGVEDAAVRATEEDEPSAINPSAPAPAMPSPPPPTPVAPIAGVPAAPLPHTTTSSDPPSHDETRQFVDDDRPSPGLISTVPGLGSGHPPVGHAPAPPSGALHRAAPQPAPATPPTATPPPLPPAPPAPPAPLAPTNRGLETDAPPPPFSPPASGAPNTPVVGEPDLDDADDSETRRRPAAPPPPPTPVPGPMVQAVHCPDGHPNPPHASTCRQCDQSIVDRTVHPIARPPLGRLVFASGNGIELTQPLLIGRRPPANASIEGEPARSVALKDPDKLLSRVHAEIRLVDWQVQVVDRDSMNHTFIEIPGHPPTQLRPADPHPIPPGTTINLGDAIRITYEVRLG